MVGGDKTSLEVGGDRTSLETSVIVDTRGVWLTKVSGAGVSAGRDASKVVGVGAVGSATSGAGGELTASSPPMADSPVPVSCLLTAAVTSKAQVVHQYHRSALVCKSMYQV